jgi:SAM-dependent methyltransferase
MQYGLFWPLAPSDKPYSRAPLARAAEVPPPSLRAGYGTSADGYLASGREDIDTMRDLLADSGFPMADATVVLDLGCAAGRMTRWIPPAAPSAQVWGADIWSEAIMWCQDNLPSCRFVTTTMVPHLPFEDRSVDLVCCGSLFTHLDDLADMWFMELRRIIRPGGRLYFSVNDRAAVKIFDGGGDPADYPRYQNRSGGRANWDAFIAGVTAEPEYQRFRRGDAYMVTLGRSMNAHVLWDSDVLCDRLTWGWRRVSVTPRAYGHQSVILLERA